MKRFLVLLLTLCLLAPCAAQAFTPTPTPTPPHLPGYPVVIGRSISDSATLTAIGTAKVEKQTDYGILRFDMEASAETVLLAQEQMESMTSSLRSALEAQGVAESEIRSADYDLRGVYEYNYTKYGEQRILTGYAITTAFLLHVESTDRAAALIAAVNETGVNCSYSLAFETRDDPEAYDVALAKAAKEAMRNAQVLAHASGLMLNELLSIEETENADQAVVHVTYSVK